MPKLFVCSDIHSAYTPWMKALNDAGFDKNNPDHFIVLCGDLFDRMEESYKAYKFAKDMIEQGKLIYIKGNHESLLLDCCKRGYWESHDISNGTAKTVYDLGYGEDFGEMCQYTLRKVKPLFNKAINYLETKNYIFVHSWIPVIDKDGLPVYYTRNRHFEFNPDWRNANQKDWETAVWGNPFNMAGWGLNQTGKVIVFGHWHCSTGWAKSEGRSEFGADAKFEPYYGDGFIAIDSCVAHTGKCNVLVLEDEFISDKNNA